MHTRETILNVEELTKRYSGKVVVNKVDIDAHEGEILGILGHNGAGKTTLIECIQGLRHRDSGTVSIVGYDPQKHRRKVRDIVGSQLQQSELPAKIKVGEAFQLFSRKHEANIPDLLKEWGLQEKEHAYFSSLSGGQKQKLFIALALINEPKIVFLDELTTGLDPFARREVWKSIKKIRRKGVAVVLVSHFIDEVEELCDRIIIMKKGVVKARGTVQEISEQYADEVTVKFDLKGVDIDVTSFKMAHGMEKVVQHGRKVTLIGTQKMVLHVGTFLQKHKITPHNLEIHQASLEEAFIKINGGHYA